MPAAEQGRGGPFGRQEAGPFRLSGLLDPPVRAADSGEEADALAAVPLLAEMFSGLLVVGREPGTGGLGEAAIREAIAFGRAVTPHLRLIQLLSKYRELMIRDDQTQSFNRRYFESFLEEEFIRAERYGSKLSVIFIDLDDLKRVNELHGHAMGSMAIRKVARCLQLPASRDPCCAGTGSFPRPPVPVAPSRSNTGQLSEATRKPTGTWAHFRQRWRTPTPRDPALWG